MVKITRLEMLKRMYEHCKNEDTSLCYKLVQDSIGEEYYSELDHMGFIKRKFYNCLAYVCLSYLGRAYCDEIFN